MINLTIHTQPDDESCGPTSLHAVYQYYGVEIDLEEVIKTVERSHTGGTLAPMLGKHALMLDFDAVIYVNNVNMFDPTWFEHERGDPNRLTKKLKAQLKYKNNPEFFQMTQAHIEFLGLGGHIHFRTISVRLLKSLFKQKIPVLTGLSATYLYRSPREFYSEDGISTYDDLRGTPCGHFVVLCGYNDKHRLMVVADPHLANPISHDNYYEVSSNRLINAIMLGVLTNDANLLIIKPKAHSWKLL